MRGLKAASEFVAVLREEDVREAVATLLAMLAEAEDIALQEEARKREAEVDELMEALESAETELAQTKAELEAVKANAALKQQEPKPEPKKAAAKKPTTKKKAEIDIGKVRALRTAGWSVPKIADEMGCSDQTIYNHMKKHGIK